jgi:hypothetical protein
VCTSSTHGRNWDNTLVYFSRYVHSTVFTVCASVRSQNVFCFSHI